MHFKCIILDYKQFAMRNMFSKWKLNCLKGNNWFKIHLLWYPSNFVKLEMLRQTSDFINFSLIALSEDLHWLVRTLYCVLFISFYYDTFGENSSLLLKIRYFWIIIWTCVIIIKWISFKWKWNFFIMSWR